MLLLINIMVLDVEDPLQGDFPEVIEEYLEYGIMKCAAFNRRGTLLAGNYLYNPLLLFYVGLKIVYFSDRFILLSNVVVKSNSKGFIEVYITVWS